MIHFNKKYIHGVIAFILLTFIAGCQDDHLLENHPSEVTTDFLYKSAEGLQSAVSGLYTIDRSNAATDESNYFAFIMGDAGTDLDFNRASRQRISRYSPLVDFTTEPMIRNWWNKWYRLIERANSIIYFGEEADIDENSKKAILREAYIFRAYAYFWLVRKFENIWLNTDPTTYQNIDNRTYNVAAKSNVYDLIISDLDTALSYYGNDWSAVPGRFNQGVARLLRADVALWLNDWQTAADHAGKIITDGPFRLEQPDRIFTKDGRNNTSESMYVMQFDEFAAGGGTRHRLPLIFTTEYRQVPGCVMVSEYGGYGWTRIHPNPYLISLYDDKNDLRWDAWWKHYYTYNDPEFDFSRVPYNFGDTLKPGQSGSLRGNNYYRNANIGTKKYWDWVKDPKVTTSYNNVYIFRYPLVLFIAAEANMRLGKDDIALGYLNQIRTSRIRSTAPDRLLTSINQDILLEEFARELALEGHRWFMLKRLNILVERVQLHGGVTSFRGIAAPDPAYYEARTNIQPFHIRWPIPQAERDAMGGFPQNEGY
jgi:starch-binding outer membrane protein, SusD/RagB family